MKAPQFYQVSLSLLMVATLVACSSTPTATDVPVKTATGSQSSSGAASGNGLDRGSVIGVNGSSSSSSRAASSAASGPFGTKVFQDLYAKREIFFDYDTFEVKLDYFPVLEAHGKWLKAKTADKVLLQGNADERGSSEYNLALGQKRAEAVKNMLKQLGAKDEQVEAVSLGKEKPRNPGHDEAAWAENRRVDIIYK